MTAQPLSQESKPLAVVITGDARFIHDREVVVYSGQFYQELLELLEAKGFEVEFDNGRRFTYPNRKAVVWIGHDTGIARFRHARSGIRTIALKTLAGQMKFATLELKRKSRENYTLCNEDKKALASLGDPLP